LIAYVAAVQLAQGLDRRGDGVPRARQPPLPGERDRGEHDGGRSLANVGQEAGSCAANHSTQGIETTRAGMPVS
jgi:hypothetical protein